jgi:antitoxin (DNA-binding transcriptional repressor) of toxin-antitoxin stability system
MTSMPTIRATEAARQFSDLLNRARYREESFDIVRGGEVVARLVPATGRRVTVRALFELLDAGARRDTTLADDLEQIQHAQSPMPEDPWAT